ncbi:hypothetical protein Trydic_g11817 [Trypoxylus dichotomus]
MVHASTGSRPVVGDRANFIEYRCGAQLMAICHNRRLAWMGTEDTLRNATKLSAEQLEIRPKLHLFQTKRDRRGENTVTSENVVCLCGGQDVSSTLPNYGARPEAVLLHILPGKHVTLQTLKDQLKTKGIVELCRQSLSTLLKEIGFKYEKEGSRRALIEKHDIALLRSIFLKKYMANLMSSSAKLVVFLNETWIYSKSNKIRSWQDGTIKSVRKP